MTEDGGGDGGLATVPGLDPKELVSEDMVGIGGTTLLGKLSEDVPVTVVPNIAPSVTLGVMGVSEVLCSVVAVDSLLVAIKREIN